MGELIKRKRKQAFACFLFCLQGAFSAGNELTLRGFVQHGTLVHAKTAVEPHLADPAGGNKALIGVVIHIGHAVRCLNHMAQARIIDNDIGVAARRKMPLRGKSPYSLAGFSLRSRHIRAALIRLRATP